MNKNKMLAGVLVESLNDSVFGSHIKLFLN